MKWTLGKLLIFIIYNNNNNNNNKMIVNLTGMLYSAIKQSTRVAHDTWEGGFIFLK